MRLHYLSNMKKSKRALEVESALTDRYQTTVPNVVRRALKLGRRDRIVYRVLDDSTVVIARKRGAGKEDPVIVRFLAFLARDMAAHPERMHAIDRGLRDRMRSLTRGVEVDLAAPLAAEDE